MWAAWMVTVNGWLLAFGAVLALAGCVLVFLVAKDEVGYARDRRASKKRQAAKQRQHSR